LNAFICGANCTDPQRIRTGIELDGDDPQAIRVGNGLTQHLVVCDQFDRSAGCGRAGECHFVAAHHRR
jgi:hypothetical protein